MADLYLLFLALFAVFLTPAMAQQDNSPLSSPTDNDMPTHTDSAHDDDQGPSDTVSLVNYYFVFLALVVCFAGLAIFFFYKRKKKQGVFVTRSREGALQRDLNSWDPIRARRRYWHGRWRSTDESREEGLNEFGEAPPPYVPKSNDGEGGQQSAANGPAVPMQALSREHAGLKPPDYAEAYAPSGADHATPSVSAYPQHPPTTQQTSTPNANAHSAAPRFG